MGSEAVFSTRCWTEQQLGAAQSVIEWAAVAPKLGQQAGAQPQFVQGQRRRVGYQCWRNGAVLARLFKALGNPPQHPQGKATNGAEYGGNNAHIESMQPQRLASVKRNSLSIP